MGTIYQDSSLKSDNSPFHVVPNLHDFATAYFSLKNPLSRKY